MYHRITLAVLALTAVACGGAAQKNDQIEETPLMPPQDETTSAETAEAPAPASGAHPGEIRRGDLTAILDRGPGAVLAMVETEPHRENGQFVGFTLSRFPGGAPAALDLREGDVLLKVNGLRIATPDDYFRAFQELKVASELRFEILRGDKRLTLTYPVVN